MRIRQFLSLALVCALSITLISCSKESDISTETATGPNSTDVLRSASSGVAGTGRSVGHTPAGKLIAVQFVTRDTAEVRPIPPIDGTGTDEGLCFDGALIDLKTGRIIGTATDCLADISGDPASGMSLVGTTIFNLPGGSVVSRGNTTVQPILTDPSGTPITHITGAVPNPGENSIIGGTGRYQNATGSVRLSGAVNLSELGDGIITFDCVFVIRLD